MVNSTKQFIIHNRFQSDIRVGQLTNINNVRNMDTQGLTNYAHSDEHACNMHAKMFSRAQNYVHVNQSKHF